MFILALVIRKRLPPFEILSLLILRPLSDKAYASNVAEKLILSLFLNRFVPVDIRIGDSLKESTAKL